MNVCGWEVGWHKLRKIDESCGQISDFCMSSSMYYGIIGIKKAKMLIEHVKPRKLYLSVMTI